MSVSPSYFEFVLEQLERVAPAPVTHRKMFGGVGFYAGEWYFAIIVDDTLFFKVDDVTRPDYDAAGMPPFRPYGPGTKPMNYYQVPADVLEDTDKLTVWMREAIEVSKRAGKKKRSRKKR